MPERYNPAFTPANVQSARDDRGVSLERLPFGVVVVDRNAKVVDYNEYEDQLASTRAEIVGKDFFKEVAPWAAVSNFQGRWHQFVSSSENMILPFDFILPSREGPVAVTIMFVRLAFDSEHATICIARKADAASR